MSEDFKRNIAEFLSVVKTQHATKSGHIYMVKMQFKLYHYLTSKLKFVHTVCETGRNDYCIIIRVWSMDLVLNIAINII